MNIDMVNYTLKPFEFLKLLDDTEKTLFFFALDYITDHIIHRGEYPPNETFDGLTIKTHITTYVWAYIQQQDRETLRQKVAAINEWKPLFLAVPPGQATGHRISVSEPVRKTEAPLSGAPLLDGRATTWNDRLKEKSNLYHGETSGPLILNYHEARQIRAEYASLEFKAVSPSRGADFPNTVDEQRQLVGKLYDAIMNMDDILEKKRPISLKKAVNMGEVDSSKVEKDVTAENSTTTPPRKKRAASELDCDAGNESTGQCSQGSSEEDEHDEDSIQPQQTAPTVNTNVTAKPKETISVIKVKSLSRIEVEILCWEILYTIRDVDRGQLPFMSWSGRDWGWDAQFSTFLERFDAVATTLRQSKAAVCSLLESDYMARLAAHPRREYRRKENNRSQNAERNAQVFIGRHAIGTGQVQVGTTGDLQDRDGNVVAAAGTVHSGLIEQTRKLGEMGRRDAKAKRARLLTSAGSGAGCATACEQLAADLAAAADGDNTANSDASITPPQRKPCVRKRKPVAKAPAADVSTKMVAGPSTEAGMTKQTGEAEIKHQETPQQAVATQASADFMGRTLSSCSSMTMVSPSASKAGFVSMPATPFGLPSASSGSTSAVTTPASPFSPIPSAWASKNGTLLSTAQANSTALGMGNLPKMTLENFNSSSLGTTTNSFPSAISGLNLLNSSIPYALPFHPVPARNSPGNAEASGQALVTHWQVSPDVITDAPMDDPFGITAMMNTTTSSGNNVFRDTTTLLPRTVAENTTEDAMAIKWDMDEQSNLLDYSISNTVSSGALNLGMDLDTGLETYPFNPDFWAMQNETDFDHMAGGGSGSSRAGAPEGSLN
ncbi:hypothetical protein SBRCBS47491_003216 [Sporothrix bragantina]|uniref:Uncharacterized protein n=1 Tax=Sporothrix bragantina TaxID=671064 RepID=A0ABP0BDN2_9PEZI